MNIVRIDPIAIFLLVAVLSISQSAQTAAENKASLAGIERSIDRGEIADVEHELFRYITSNTADALGFYLFAKLRFKQGRFSESRSMASKALSLDAGLVKAKMLLAQCALQLGERDQLTSVLSSLSDNDLSDAATRLEIGGLYAQIGDCDSAVKVLEKLPVEVKKGAALPVRARCLLLEGKVKQLAALIPLAAIQVRKDPGIVVAFSAVLFGGGLYKETAGLTRQVIKAYPDNFEGLLLLSRSEIHLNDLKSAKVHLAKAETLRADSAELFFTRSLLETEEGNFQAAYDALEKSLGLNSGNPGTLAQYVVSALRVGQAGRALKAAERLLKMQPDNPEFSYLYGIASLQNDNVLQAEEALAKYADVRPKDSRGCLALGLVYSAQKDRASDARKQLLKCLTIDPRNVEAAYQIGLSFKAEGDFVKAITYFEQAINIAPNYAAAVRELGIAYLQTGLETKARKYLEKAAVLSPSDAETHFQLSRLYNIIGERELGKKHFEIFQKLKDPKKNGM